MTSNVVDFTGITTLDIPPERVLNKALEANLEKVVVIGYDQDGNEYFASSISDGAYVVWLMERCKKRLLDVSL